MRARDAHSLSLRRLLSAEIGACLPASAVRQRWCLLYPNTYWVGMSNLGVQVVYHALNEQPAVGCERAFLPEPAHLARLEATRRPVRSLETQTPLHAFDVLAFSLSYELDYPNVLRLLALGGLAWRASERQDQAPLIIAGGPCATFNPEPLAEVVDAFVVGEAEEVVGPLVAAVGDRHLPRGERLERLAAVEGVYVPSLYEAHYGGEGGEAWVEPRPGAPAQVRRRWVADLDAWPAHSHVLSPHTEFGHMFLVEVARGCGRACRFCVADASYRPLRRRSAERILQTAADGLRHRRTIGLVGASVSDHPEVDRICAGILAMGGQVAVASLRADSVTPGLIEALARQGTRTITVAPEAGTQRLRDVIGKGLTFDHVARALSMSGQAGITQAKLYFMIGLPTEQQEDVLAIAEMVAELSAQTPVRRFHVSVSPFVPKPGTPLERSPMNTARELEGKLKVLRRRIRALPHAELTAESVRWSLVQALLARGDRRLGAVIARAAELGGRLAAWRQALAEAGMDERRACRPRQEGERLPWQHIASRWWA